MGGNARLLQGYSGFEGEGGMEKYQEKTGRGVPRQGVKPYLRKRYRIRGNTESDTIRSLKRYDTSRMFKFKKKCRSKKIESVSLVASCAAVDEADSIYQGGQARDSGPTSPANGAIGTLWQPAPQSVEIAFRKCTSTDQALWAERKQLA